MTNLPELTQLDDETLRKILEERRATVRHQAPAEEWTAREDLAACYRLCARYRMTDLIYNHISLRVPGRHDQFLINAFGLMYEEVSASNLIKVDLEGRPVDDAMLEANPAGFVIHSAIHRARTDVDCVFHTHTRAGIAVSARREGLLSISQHAMRFHGRIGYHDFEGIALDQEEQTRLVQDLGAHNALILRNHGLLTCGNTVRAAFEEMYFLEMACQIQIDATAHGSELVHPPSPICEHAAEQFAASNRWIQGRDWRALRRLLDQSDPSYRT